MTVYFEGTGEPRAATFSEVRDLFIDAVNSKRDEILAEAEQGKYEAYVNPNAAMADDIVSGVLGVIEGNHPDCPGFSLIPKVGEEEKAEAIEAGGNWIPFASEDVEAIDISDGVVDYFKLVNS
ncbi:hypothetical protein [Pseudomonas phage PA1C]|uniref:Uncharacterized protein n=1 Tax=Pseudomonas phage vB_PaeM_PS119XW TaxID=2601632 RepID=A0A5C1K798_9CAUD|nr:hypothetical protein PP933_gp309 [Pseudomonas phage vB_PaeM_PS119XW]QBX32466.1 hypothetical protein [Pseudomonas phage PA1C]QEM42038.1 hypothetical protein [Pseudomonas phage vB_PaeM_PS119XW]BEG72553.1 hypothetical protein RVBP21_1810 [Pseudomonas phage BRkr]